MKKMSTKGYSLIVIMVMMLVVIALSLGMPYYSRLLPLIFGSIVFLLSAIKLWQEFSSRDRKEEALTEGEVSKIREGKAPLRAYLLAGAWITGLILSLYLLGFRIVAPLFVFSYMKSHGTRWRTSIIFGIIILVIVYFGFERSLDVDLYQGLLFQWLERLSP